MGMILHLSRCFIKLVHNRTVACPHPYSNRHGKLINYLIVNLLIIWHAFYDRLSRSH
jgi:hypothetical protein